MFNSENFKYLRGLMTNFRKAQQFEQNNGVQISAENSKSDFLVIL